MVWEYFGFGSSWIWWDLFGIKICGVLEEIQKPERINYRIFIERCSLNSRQNIDTCQPLI